MSQGKERLQHVSSTNELGLARSANRPRGKVMTLPCNHEAERGHKRCLDFKEGSGDNKSFCVDS